MPNLTTALVTTLLLLLPLAVFAEQAFVDAWPSRLFIPEFNPPPNRHTPIHYEGTYLPPVITKDLTLSPSHNPVLLGTTIHINPEATLTIEPGTKAFAHENARLTVAGHLRISGTQNRPVIFSTNEQHPLNQTWLGIVAEQNSRVDITHTIIQYASPAISCLDSSQTTINNIHIRQGNTGIYQTSTHCLINNSRIYSTRDGIISINTEPAIHNTTISAAKNKIIKILSPQATP